MSEKKAVLCRNVKIGGGAPVSIQSMTNTPTADDKATMEQIRRLEEAGCQIVRMAVPDMEAARALYDIRKQTDLPLVADIHFDHRLALEAIRAGMDKIRINPGNIGSQDKVKEVVEQMVTELGNSCGVPVQKVEVTLTQDTGAVAQVTVWTAVSGKTIQQEMRRQTAEACGIGEQQVEVYGS